MKKLWFFLTFSLIGWFSKYDFCNLWKISDRHRCSEKFSSKKIRRKKFEIFWSKIFWSKKIRSKNLDFGILGFWKFWTFRNFKILENFGKFLKTAKKIKIKILNFSDRLKVSPKQCYWRWKQRLWCRFDSGICNFRISAPSPRKILSLQCTQASPWGVRRLVYL